MSSASKHLSPKHPPHRIATLAGILAMCAALAACSQPTPPIEQHDLAQLTLQAIAYSRVVYIDEATGDLASNAQYGINSLVFQTGAAHPERLRLFIKTIAPAKMLHPLADSLVSRGVVRDKIEYRTGPIDRAPSPREALPSDAALSVRHKGHRDGLWQWSKGRWVHAPAAHEAPHFVPVELIALRYQVVPPTCPDKSVLPDDKASQENQTTNDFGCAFIADFGAQVADPGDLVRGESGGVTDSILTNAAIERLQSDQVKALLDVKTSSGGGS